jgi:hypothetical protein
LDDTETDFENVINWITTDVPIQVHSTCFSDRIPAQPPSCIWIISPIQSQIEEKRTVGGLILLWWFHLFDALTLSATSTWPAANRIVSRLRLQTPRFFDLPFRASFFVDPYGLADTMRLSGIEIEKLKSNYGS